MGKAFTQPSEARAKTFNFSKKNTKKRPTYQLSSPICEVSRGATNTDVPPSSAVLPKTERKVCAQRIKTDSHPPPQRQRLLPRLATHILRIVAFPKFSLRPASVSPAYFRAASTPGSENTALSLHLRAPDGRSPQASPSGVYSLESHSCLLSSQRDGRDTAHLPLNLSSARWHKACHPSLQIREGGQSPLPQSAVRSTEWNAHPGPAIPRLPAPGPV